MKGMSDCFWCENIIHDYIGSWVDVYGDVNCKYHPVAWDIANSIPTGKVAPHQDYLEVHAFIVEAFEAKQPKKPTLRLVRNNANDTSFAAANSININALEQTIYDAIKNAGDYGITADELRNKFPNLSYSSVTARPSALKAKGLVQDSGRRRAGISGRLQVVLVATGKSNA